MADASLPLQKAIVAALKGDAGIQAIAGLNEAPWGIKVFDVVPSTPRVPLKPYISLGPTQLNPDLAAEYEGSAERIQVDVWSTTTGKVEVKRLGRAIHSALQGATLTLEENQRLVLIQIEQTQYLTEQDGLTQHGVLIFVAHTEPTA